MWASRLTPPTENCAHYPLILATKRANIIAMPVLKEEISIL